jgi:hypothetical protein
MLPNRSTILCLNRGGHIFGSMAVIALKERRHLKVFCAIFLYLTAFSRLCNSFCLNNVGPLLLPATLFHEQKCSYKNLLLSNQNFFPISSRERSERKRNRIVSSLENFHGNSEFNSPPQCDLVDSAETAIASMLEHHHENHGLMFITSHSPLQRRNMVGSYYK